MRTHGRAVITLLASGLALALGLAPTASADFVVVGRDPAGDVADGSPGRDIVGVAFSYDRREGRIEGGIRLRGAMTDDAPATVTLLAGRRTATGCGGYPAIGFATQTDLTNVDWVRFDAAAGFPQRSGPALKRYDATSEEYEATASSLAGTRPDCVVAQLSDPGDAAVVYDVAGPYRLRGVPELEAVLGRLPTRMKPGRTRRIRLTLRNPGDGPTGRVRLTASRARGLTVRLPKRISQLRPGARRTISVAVTLSRRARGTTTLRLRATAPDRLHAEVAGDLYLNRAAPRSDGGDGGGGDSGDRGPRLCVRYHWLPPYSRLVPC